MTQDIPFTIGYNIDKALSMLKDYNVIVEETSTVFEDKKQERLDNIPIVVRQLNKNIDVYLTVTRFK